MPMGGSSDPAAAARDQQRKDERAINAGMKQINTAFAGFTPEFFQTIQDRYQAFAQPQLGEQFRNQQRSVKLGLASRGLLQSGSAIRQNRLLNAEKETQERNLANEGLRIAQQRQGEVEAQRGNLVNQLIASRNPDVLAGGIQSSVAGLKSPSVLSPVGDLFSTFSNIYAAKKLSDAYSPVIYGGGGGRSAVGSSSNKVIR